MVYFKLEDAIKGALKGQYFGKNKVIVETTTLGEIIITDFEDSAEQEEIAELESEIEELELENENLKESLKAAEKRIAELEEELE